MFTHLRQGQLARLEVQITIKYHSWPNSLTAARDLFDLVPRATWARNFHAGRCGACNTGELGHMWLFAASPANRYSENIDLKLNV